MAEKEEPVKIESGVPATDVDTPLKEQPSPPPQFKSIESGIPDNERPDVERQSIVDELDHASDAFPMREMVIKLPLLNGEAKFNPFTSLFGFGVLWGLAIWCMVMPTEAKNELIRWKSQCTLFFTWFYIGTKPIFTFFVLWLAIRFRNVRLGPQDSKPEFSNSSYFTMLFSAGIAVGLFFFGVSEPLWHQSSHWFAEQGYRTQDEIDQFAINQTLYHWGLAGWGQYIIVAICAGLSSFKFGLPLTYRSCFYPLLGDYTWGWIGDLIDGFTIVTTVAGVCTSLGLGAMQIVAGLIRLDAIDENASTDYLIKAQAITIWVITAIATISVVSGLNVGIQLLSNFGFALGMLLLFLCLTMDNTAYIFNLIVQSTGYYLQYSLILINFWTDAFGQLNEGEGRSIDGKSAETWWMDAWAVFYMAWWTAWAGFVGLFVARISRGRTIAEVVMFSFIVPFLYTLLWFCTFGGIGIRQARQALELEQLGQEHYGDPGEFRVPGNEFCYNVPQQDVVVNGTTIFTNSLPGVTPVCEFNSNDPDSAWFNVMFSFSFQTESMPQGFGPFMAGLSLFAVLVYFVTSSDSGSLIVDHLAANGQFEHHWLQRVFWAFTEGGVATALLMAGGTEALQALQAASVVSGLPFTVFICYQCHSTVIMCYAAEKAESQKSPFSTPMEVLQDRLTYNFSMPIFGGIFNIFEYIVSLGRVHEERVKNGMDLPTKFQAVEFFKALFLPFLSIYRVYSLAFPKPAQRTWNLVRTAMYGVFFVGWIIMFILSAVNRGFIYFGWTIFFMNAIVMLPLRQYCRGLYNVKGNVFDDFLCSSFFYPMGLVQLLNEFEVNPQPTAEEVEK